MSAHARLSPSGAHRWMNCPGSVRLSEGRESPASVYALEGTAAHSLLERALRKGLDADTWLDSEIDGIEVTENMAEAVQVCLDYVHGRFPDTRAALASGSLLLETRIDLAKLNPPEPMFGRLDCVGLASDDLLEVIDYKHGAGVVVSPVENPQGLYYTAGAALAALPRRFKRFRFTIVQPRAYHPDGIVRSWEFDRDRLAAFTRELFDRARATHDPAAPLVVGEWCRFCPALAVCPAQHANAVTVVETEFDALAAPGAGPPAPETLTDEQIELVLSQGDTIEAWVRAVRAYVQGVKERGETVLIGPECVQDRFPNWKLVPKRATRRWGNEDGLTAWLRRHHVPEEEWYTAPKLKSPAQIEKVLKTVKTKPKLPAEYVTAESSGYNLVPADDPRPAVAPMDGFEALPAPKEESR